MDVLVTGGAGFIGANVVRTLLQTEGVDSVRVLDDFSTGFRENIDGLDIDVIEGSVCDFDTTMTAVTGTASIVHLGALGSVPRSIDDPIASHEANATGTLKVLEAARAHGNVHTILAGSSSVYGNCEILPTHEDLPTSPVSPYAASKVAAEAYALAYQVAYAVPVLAFRFFNVYGPFQPTHHAYASVMPAFIDAALAGRPLPVHGDGNQSRDFIYVGTLAEVIARAVVQHTCADGPINLALGSQVSLLEIIDLLEQILERPLDRQHGETRAGDPRHSRGDPARLHQLFPGLEPVGFAEGLRATVEWWQGRGRD